MKFEPFNLLVLCLTLTGCMITVDSDHSSNADWDDYDVNQIEIGRTSSDWIVASFGEPGSKRTNSDGNEVWKYKNIRERDTKVAVFLLFHFDIEREQQKILNIEIRDNIVVDYALNTHWTE